MIRRAWITPDSLDPIEHKARVFLASDVRLSIRLTPADALQLAHALLQELINRPDESDLLPRSEVPGSHPPAELRVDVTGELELLDEEANGKQQLTAARRTRELGPDWGPASDAGSEPAGDLVEGWPDDA